MELNIIILKFVFILFFVEYSLYFLNVENMGNFMGNFFKNREVFYFVLFILISNKFILAHSKKESNMQISTTPNSSSCNESSSITTNNNIYLKFVWLNACLCFFIVFLLSITILLSIDVGFLDVLIGKSLFGKRIVSFLNNIINSVYSTQIINICQVFSNTFITMLSIQIIVCLINEYRRIHLVNALNICSMIIYLLLYFSKNIYDRTVGEATKSWFFIFLKITKFIVMFYTL